MWPCPAFYMAENIVELIIQVSHTRFAQLASRGENYQTREKFASRRREEEFSQQIARRRWDISSASCSACGELHAANILSLTLTANWDKRTIQKAFDDYEKYTCLKFEPVPKGTRSYIYFQNGDGCSSRVGRYRSAQAVTLYTSCRRVSMFYQKKGDEPSVRSCETK